MTLVFQYCTKVTTLLASLPSYPRRTMPGILTVLGAAAGGIVGGAVGTMGGAIVGVVVGGPFGAVAGAIAGGYAGVTTGATVGRTIGSTVDADEITTTITTATDTTTRRTSAYISGTGDTLIILSSDGIKADSTNPVYAIQLKDGISGWYKCKLDRCSTVYFAAVKLKDKPKYAPHCGLLLENTFHLSKPDGTSSEYSYVLVHALPSRNKGKTTYLLINFCDSKDAAFRELAKVFKKDPSGFENSISPGWRSSKPCADVISHLQSEMNRPFDPHWQSRLDDDDTSDKADMATVTNCAMFASRIYYVLASDGRKEETIKEITAVFQKLGIPESKIKKYESLLKRL